MYIAIVEVTDNKKLARYQPCKTEADAIAHSEKYGGFVVKDIGGNSDFWIVDKDKKTITQDTVTENRANVIKDATAEIHRLESTVTPRRIREMTTADGAKWVDNIEKLIAIERAKL
jgi:hypothetical protein